MGDIQKRNVQFCVPLGCTVYHLACTVQPSGHEWGKCLHFHMWGRKYCANENVTLGSNFLFTLIISFIKAFYFVNSSVLHTPTIRMVK